MIVNNAVKSNFDVYNHSLALEFYSNVLYNVSTYSEFPIDRLIGHRGQAPPEVRRVATNVVDLKMFLTRYPSIFRVTENDCVRLVKTVADCRKTVEEVKVKEETYSNSDNAVQFYVNVMKKKLSTGDKCLTLKSLIGHRGCAPPDVQNCAKNIDELYSFLSNHPQSFTLLPGNLVTLAKNVPSATDAKNHSLKPTKCNENDSTLAVVYYSKILSTTGPNYSILRLIGHRGQAPPEVKRVALTDKDLKSFLLRFPKIFSVTGNFVTLKNISPAPVPPKEKCNLKSGTYPENSSSDTAVQFYANVLKEKGYCGIEFPIQKLTGYRNKAPLDVQNCAKNPSELYKLFSNYPNVFTLKTKNSVILNESSQCNLVNKEQNLSLTSEVNCDESTKAIEYYVNILLLQAPNSDIPITSLMIYLNQAPFYVRKEARNKKELIQFFLKHSDVFVVVKNQYVKLADTPIQSNNAVQNTKLKSVDCIRNLIEDKTEKIFTYFPTLDHWENPGFSGDWEHHVLDNTALITEEDECLEACEIIKKEKIIAFDCEGYNLGHGIISLIQIALVNGTVYIFDIYGLPRMISLGLKEIIESDKILKVINHCRNDCLNLKMQYNVNLNFIFDVSIAYHVIENKIMSQSNFKPAGLNQMCENYCVPINSCKDDMKFVYITQPNYWLTRPLNIKMVSYAAFDVASLVPYLYSEFLKRMDYKTESAIWRLSQRMCIT